MNFTLLKSGIESKHKLPKHWDEISLKKYVRVMKSLEDKKVKTELEKIVDIVTILSDVPEKDILRLPVKNINQLGLHLTKFLKTLPNDELNHTLKIKGVEYGFHPKLSDISFGEWVDIDALITAGANDNLHKIMSILYRPIIAKKGDKYQIEPYEPCKDREQIMLDNLTVGDFYGVSVFFSDLGRELLNHTLTSSIQKLKEARKEREKI
tara:strand:+ start:7106 stop:7732 length:627 start_codon:yes stop_codon:yes gene_type:complete